MAHPMRLLLPLTVLMLAACAAPRGPGLAESAPLDCSTRAAFAAGSAGAPRDARCEDGNYEEAWRLGSSLRGLRAEVAALQVQIDAAGPEGAGAQIRQQRQRQIDIEAIEGLARINGWE
jgi:hypothetical protein